MYCEHTYNNCATVGLCYNKIEFHSSFVWFCSRTSVCFNSLISLSVKCDFIFRFLNYFFECLFCFISNVLCSKFRISVHKRGVKKPVQMSPEKIGKRRATGTNWTVSDTENVNDSNEAKKTRLDSELIQLDCNETVIAQVKKPAAKIVDRRRSLRLSNKTLQLNNNDTSKNSPAVRRTTTTSTTSTSAVLQANSSTEATTSTAPHKNKVFKVRTRCDLSESISSCYNDKMPDPSNPKRYSAKCTLCDINEPRKFFWTGNNSNLKSHISRVNTTIKIDQL